MSGVAVPPRVAFCISGQLRYEYAVFPQIAQMAADLGATVFVSTWSRRGGKTSGIINRDQAQRMFGAEMGDAMPALLVSGTNFTAALPEFERTMLATFSTVTAEQVRQSFPDAIVDIEDENLCLDFAEAAVTDRNSLRMLYKIWRCNELKRQVEKQRGAPFDLVVRFRPDVVPDLGAAQVAAMLGDDRDSTIYIPGAGLGVTHVDDVMSASSSTVADRFASLFGKALLSPARPWHLIHSEIFAHLAELGLTARSTPLRAWITEDPPASQPANRRAVLALLAEGRINPDFFPRATTWASLGHLLRAASALAEQASRVEVLASIDRIDLAAEDADFVGRAAWLLASASLRANDSAAFYVASLVALFCDVEATAGQCLAAEATRARVEQLEHHRGHLGLSEPCLWRSLPRLLAPALFADPLRRLVAAAEQVLAPERRLEIERRIAALCPGVQPEPDTARAALRAADALAPDRPAEAERACLAALAASADAMPDALNLLAHVRRLQGRPDAALEPARRAAALAPVNGQLHAQLADLLDTLDDPSAVDAWRMAVERSRQNPDALVRLGRALARPGQRAEARNWVEQASALLPEDATIVARLAELRENPVAAAPEPAPTPAPAPVPAPTAAWAVLLGDGAPPPALEPPAAAPRAPLLRRLFGRR